MALVEGLIILGAVLYILYKWGTSTYDHWKKKGINSIKPRIPFLGGRIDVIFRKEAEFEPMIVKIYNLFPGQRFGGWFKYRQPILVLRDLELIKKVLINDFEYFLNRNISLDTNFDPVLGKSLIALHGQKWKDTRNIISHGFTASKMKDMLISINKCGKQMTDYLNEVVKRQVEENHPDKNMVTLEFQEFFRRFTVDAMAAIHLGMEINSMKDPENQLNKLLEERLSMTKWRKMKFFLFFLFPSLMKVLKIKYLGLDSTLINFFKNQFYQNIKQREKQNIVRNDLLHALCSARNGKITNENHKNGTANFHYWDNEDVLAQTILLFFAAIESLPGTLGFIAQELAENPEIQKRLQSDIDQIIEEDNGISYDGIMHKMKYLDMVVSEGLRKWPPFTKTSRKASMRYKIPGTENSPEVVLEVGDVVDIPISALLRNAEYFPEPLKFDPERFNEENKQKINPFLLLLPFGSGPRNCVGMRFAFMTIKAVIAHLLHLFDLKIVPKSQVPPKLNNSRFPLSSENGFWLGVKPRK